MTQFHSSTSIVPEATGTLYLGKDDLRWLEAFLTNLNVSNRATVPTPVNSTDAATKGYVDGLFNPILATIEEADGSPSITNATTLRFDQADGLVLTNPSAGVVRLDLSAVPNSVLANSSVTVTAGDGLTGGGAVALGAAVTVTLDTPVTVARGGTGSATAAGARTNLGSTTVGDAVFIAASAAAARTAIGTVIGTDVEAWDADLDALAALAATAGMVSRTGAGAFAVRTIAGTTNNISVADGSGAAAAPTIDLVNAGPGATGPIGSTTVTPVVTIDAKGRVTALTSATISAPSGMRWDGAQTTEGTTTSTTAATLLTSGTVSIAADRPVRITAQIQKSTGAANTASIGLSVNGSVAVAPLLMFSATDREESGMVEFVYAPRTNGQYSSLAMVLNATLGRSDVRVTTGNVPSNATITSVVITGLVADALITVKADELQVYSQATS